jgi:ABC-2 type transport system permease protein
MTAITVTTPDHRNEVPPTGTVFTRTLMLFLLYLRRDRVVLPLSVLLLSVPLGPVYIGSIEKVYPTEADRALVALSAAASGAQRALYGNIYNDSVGAVGIWRAGGFHLLIGLVVILTVVRHTRAEEEAGLTELVGSREVGRYANLTAALLLSFGVSVATGLIATAGLLTVDVPAKGSAAFGLALAASGLVFTAVAAVTAQLSTSARTARGIAFGVLGSAFILRAVGDAGPGKFTWFSPLGWSLQVRPYAGDRWWVLLLHLMTTIVLTVIAYKRLRQRDIGTGLITERPGAPNASPRLAGPLGLAWRLQRGSLLALTLALCVYGVLIGGVVNGIGQEIGDNHTIREIVNRLGGSQTIEGSFVAITFSFLAITAAAFAISATLRLHQEETTQRGESVLATAVSRTRWATSHLTYATTGSAVAMLLAGVVAGLIYGLAADDIGGKLATVLAVAATQLPAIWLFAAVTLALFGLVPRFTPLVWAVLVGCVAIYLLGSIASFPQWLNDVVPFVHTQRIPGAPFRAAPVLWLLVIDAAVIAAGLVALRRRDLRR